jgi:type I restriction enzyme, S subunit
MTTLAEELGGAQRIIGGPFGSNLTQADYQDVGVPVIRGSNMEFNGRYIGGTFTYVSVDKATTSLRSNIARPGDIIVTQRGTMGQVSIIPSDMEYEYFVISQSQMAISVPSDTADSLFVYYFLRSQGFLDYLHTSTIQTGVPHINLTILRQTPVQWPPLHSQQAISAVLGALDDKIELNWRMNETLEATARAIFKDWFVDFGPTRSKQEGRAPYLARDIWSLFPGRLDDEGKPEGWTFERISTLGRLFRETLSPAATPDDLFDHYSLPAYDAGAEPIIERGGRILSNKTLVPRGGILLSKLNPEIQRVWLVDPERKGRAICSTEFLAFNPSERHAREFLYEVFVDPGFRQRLQALVTGTSKSHQRISPQAVLDLTVVKPTDRLLREFWQTVGAILDRVLANRREAHTLAATRDLLLPKLMSGEVRVKDAEKIVGEST